MRKSLIILWIFSLIIFLAKEGNCQQVKPTYVMAHRAIENDTHLYKYSFESIKQKEMPLSKYEYATDIVQSDDGFVWIATNVGILRYDGLNYKAFHPFQENGYSETQSTVRTLYKSKRNGLWLIGDDSLVAWFSFKSYRSEIANLQLNDTVAHIEDGFGFSLKTMSSTFYLAKNNIWIKNHLNHTSSYISLDLDSESKGKYLRSLCSIENNNLFIFYEDSIITLNLGTYEYSVANFLADTDFFKDPNGVSVGINGNMWAFHFKELYNLRRTKIYDIPSTDMDGGYFDEKRGTFWFLKASKSGNKMLWYSLFDKTADTVSNPDSISIADSYSISKINDNNLMICADRRLYEFNLLKKVIRKINQKIENYSHLSTDQLAIVNITTDSEGNLWLLDLFRRLIKYDKSTQKFSLVLKKEIYFPRFFSSGISGNNNYVLYPGRNGCVNKIDIHTLQQSVIKVTADSTNIYPVCENKMGELLLSNGSNLSLFNPLSKTYFNIDVSSYFDNGLYIDHIFLSYPQAYLDPYDNFIIAGFGTLWLYINSLKVSHNIIGFHNYDSYYTFYNSNKNELILNYDFHLPIKDLYPEEKLPINITSVSTLEKDTIFHFSDTLKLNHNQNFIAISFSALNFNSNFQNVYYVMLEGQDTAWQIMGTSNNISYANLSPGHYVFRVKAYNDHNYTVSKEKTLVFDIMPAFWQTLWFKILIWIASISIISITLFWLYKNNIQKINLKNQVEKEKLIVKQKETEFEKERALLNLKRLQAQLNPHFIFNCINSIHTYILQNKNDIADKYLMEFENLLRTVLYYSEKEKIKLSDEIAFLRSYIELEKMKSKEKFIADIPDEETGQIPNAQIPSLLLQPMVENAIRHGLLPRTGKGLLEVKTYIDNGLLIIQIKDNGIGRKKAMELKSKSKQKHESIGVSLTSDRIAALNKNRSTDNNKFNIEDIIDSDGNAGGTLVTIKLEVI